ncbi:Holliday junction resolvase RuvX [Thermoproteota archaeon]
MKRFLAMDYGDKRIGLAVSDPLNLTAQQIPFIFNTLQTVNEKELFEKLHVIIENYNVEKIILGLPLSMKGGDSPKSIQVKAFGALLADKLSCEVNYWDERVSTIAVTKHLISADVSRKKRKKVIDSQAAAYILQGYLDSL